MIFDEHLNSWLNCTHETHENWYPTNNNESTVTNQNNAFVPA